MEGEKGGEERLSVSCSLLGCSWQQQGEKLELWDYSSVLQFLRCWAFSNSFHSKLDETILFFMVTLITVVNTYNESKRNQHM